MSEKDLLTSSIAAQLSGSLAAINTRLDNIDASNKEQSESLKHLEERLFLGNGSPALVVEIDRLKQNQIRRDRSMAVLWTLVVGVLIGLSSIIADRFIGKPSRETSTVSTTISTTAKP